MRTPWAFLAFVGLVLLAGGIWALRVWRGKGEVLALRERYLRESGLPLEQAYGSLERALERSLAASPERSMRWHLQQALAALRRDRR